MRKPPRRGPARMFAATSAADAVGSVLRSRGISDEIRAGRLLTEWSDLVGPKIAQRTRPEGIHDRVLWIEVATSAWLHELNMLRTQLVQGLLERLGEPRLFDDVKFRLAGRYRRDPVLLRPSRPEQPARTTPVAATGVTRETIVREVSVVDDAELRELIARVRITHDK